MIKLDLKGKWKIAPTWMLAAGLVDGAIGLQRWHFNTTLGVVWLAIALLQFVIGISATLKPSQSKFKIGEITNSAILVGSALTYLFALPLNAPAHTQQVLGTAELSSMLLNLSALIIWIRSSHSKSRQTPKRISFAITLVVTAVLGLIGIASALNNFPQSINMSAPIAAGATPIPITTLHEPNDNQAIKQVTLIAIPKNVNGHTLWTYNGIVPGPEIRITQGDRLRVTFINHLPVATSIHWHGIRLPNAEDGVAGVTQDAVQPDAIYTYEFVAKDAGTFMYHSHQDTSNQMLRGLFGALIVIPRTGSTTNKDYSIILHETPGGNAIEPNGIFGYLALRAKELPAFNGQTSDLKLRAKPGDTVRLRLIGAIQGEAGNGTDYMIAPPRDIVLTGAPYIVQSIDGNDVNQPQQLGPERIQLGIGQRYDLVFTMPASGQVRLIDTNGRETITLGSGNAPTNPELSKLPTFNIMNYGQRTTDSILASKNGHYDVTYPMVLDFQGGLRDDKLELVQTINSQYSPMMTQYIVKEGQLVHFHIVNKTPEFHTIHIHGHTFTVVSENDQTIKGSPIHMDSLLVPPKTTWDIAFLANNPGLWMVHCHVLVHAAFGMSAMISYQNYTTPYSIGALTGNKPE